MVGKKVYDDNIIMASYDDTNMPGSSADKPPDQILGKLTVHKAGQKSNSGSYSSKGGKKDHGGTVVCGVCGAVRYYSFVKQARKFGIYSCESCRKFISKMIHSKGGGKLKCNEDKGECTVPPYVINPLDSVRYSHLKGRNARCPACWLKMCLRAFSMPGDLCAWLATRLPDYMQDPAFLSSTIPYPANPAHKYIQNRKTKQFRDIKKLKGSGDDEQNMYDVGGTEEDNDETAPKVRQKRKAATKFMENIARITGRVTDKVQEYQFSQSESIRKKGTGSRTGESWRVIKKEVKKAQLIKKEKTEDQTTEVKIKTESVMKEDEDKSKEIKMPSVQDVIRKVGRPRLIILTRNIEFNGESGGIKKEIIDENTDSSFTKNEIEDEPSVFAAIPELEKSRTCQIIRSLLYYLVLHKWENTKVLKYFINTVHFLNQQRV